MSARPIPVDWVESVERRAWAREEASAEKEAERTESPSDRFTAALVDEILHGDGKPRRQNRRLTEADLEGLSELERLASKERHPAGKSQASEASIPVDEQNTSEPIEAA